MQSDKQVEEEDCAKHCPRKYTIPNSTVYRVRDHPVVGIPLLPTAEIGVEFLAKVPIHNQSETRRRESGEQTTKKINIEKTNENELKSYSRKKEYAQGRFSNEDESCLIKWLRLLRRQQIVATLDRNTLRRKLVFRRKTS